MSDLKQLWLAPICHEDGDGRLWCEDDVWGDDCGCGIAQHSAVRYVLASDYDHNTARLRKENALAIAGMLENHTAFFKEFEAGTVALFAERDALRAQVEAMRALLVDAHWTVHLPTTEHAIIPRCRCRKCVISRIDAALQAKP